MMHLWYTNLVLATYQWSSNLLICFIKAKYSYIPNFRSLFHLHDLEGAPVIHRLGPELGPYG